MNWDNHKYTAAEIEDGEVVYVEIDGKPAAELELDYVNADLNLVQALISENN